MSSSLGAVFDVFVVELPSTRGSELCGCSGCGYSPAGLTLNLQSVTGLACHFAEIDGVDAGPAALDRARIETWLAALQTDVPSAHVGGFLRDVHRYEWQPELARSAFIYDDAPKPRAKAAVPSRAPTSCGNWRPSRPSRSSGPTTDGCC
ncbi:hypothetical protein ACFZCY_34345 [Streptomyces sp. NPDC007983]|uniref:hypothetical protein n=1 Tax=Streptomyces sp. NPDC007983 TaxID=3364800 RepID=UPI0036E45694